MQGALGSVAVLVIFIGPFVFSDLNQARIPLGSAFVPTNAHWLNILSTVVTELYLAWDPGRNFERSNNRSIELDSSPNYRRSRFAMLKIASGITPRSEYEKSGRKGHVGYGLAAGGKNGFDQRTTVFEVPSQ